MVGTNRQGWARFGLPGVVAGDALAWVRESTASRVAAQTQGPGATGPGRAGAAGEAAQPSAAAKAGRRAARRTGRWP